MRGTSGIAIGEVADMVREIMVRNVVLGNCGSPGGLAPPGSAGRLAPPPTPAAAVAGRPPYHSVATSAASPAVGLAAIGGGFLSHREGIFELRRGDF